MHKLSDACFEAARHVQALADALYAEHVEAVADKSTTAERRAVSWMLYQEAEQAASAARRLYVRLSRNVQ